MQKLVLIDGSGFIYRSFYALPPLKRSDGLPIGAAFGFTNMLISILINNSFQYLAIVFDKGKHNFRHDIYSAYKQTRRETPEDLIPQFEIIRKACDAFNVDYLEHEEFEADDIIASYAKFGIENDYNVKVISGDKDLVQLLSIGAEVYDPMKSKPVDELSVYEKYGIKPNLMRDFLALAGDTSDNVPGVKGVGPKTAATLLNTYGSVDGIYENIEKITQKKLKENLLNSRSDAFLSRDLVSLNYDAPRDKTIEELCLKDLDNLKIKNFLEEYEFHSLLKKINSLKFKDHGKVEKLQLTTFDNIYRDAIKCSYAIIDKNVIKTESMISKVIEEKDYDNVIPLLNDEKVLKITDDSKRLWHITKSLKNCDDLKIMSFMLYSTKELGEITLDFYNNVKRALEEANLTKCYEKLEKRFLKVIAEIEERGIKTDVEILKQLKIRFSEKLSQIENTIYEIAGKKFNLGSTKQLGEVLFVDLKIPPLKMNKKSGNFTTDQSVLEELSMNGYDIADHILEWRQLSKLISTYTDSLIKKVNKETGRIYTTFNVTGTLTGRLSSSDPNLQNIPIKTNEGKLIRSAFVTDEGKKLISCDYSQIELRVLAHVTGAKFLTQAFKDGKDIHKMTAAKIFHVDEDAVTDDLRRKAKAINFGIIYGMQSFGLSKRVNMSFFESSEFIKNYFALNPEIYDYMENIKKYARENGFVKTVLGRRCVIQNIDAKNYGLRKFAERQAINAPIQGSSADIIKTAMVNIADDSNITARMILQIHDELVFEVNAEDVESQKEKIIKIMENIDFVSIPLEVNAKIGNSLAEIH